MKISLNLHCGAMRRGLSCTMFARVIEIKLRKGTFFFSHTFGYIITFNLKIISTQWCKWDSEMCCMEINTNWSRLRLNKTPKSAHGVYSLELWLLLCLSSEGRKGGKGSKRLSGENNLFHFNVFNMFNANEKSPGKKNLVFSFTFVSLLHNNGSIR